jgi:aryl-alcohol dehydrogenase-like predicted oxidoreductase
LNLKLPAHPVLGPIARRHGVSPHAVVLAWVLAQGTTVIPIPSARTVAHALDSLTAAGITLSPAERAAIDGAEFSRA